MSIEDDNISFKDIELKLENPGAIKDPERREIMENVERHYIAAQKYEDADNIQYELDCAARELERYDWELGAVKGDYYGDE